MTDSINVNYTGEVSMSNITWDVAQPGFVSSNYLTPVGTNWTLNVGNQQAGLNPGLYFRFMKSKLTKIQQTKLKKQLSKLKALVDDAEELGQKGYAEELARMMAVIIREQEALVCGVDKHIERGIVEKFMYKVKDHVVKFSKLEGFPRPIPKKQKAKIMAVQKNKVFDDYWILYTDYTKEAPLKSTKEKVIEKDPICFGTFKYAPNRLYFICDWIDEYCDITLDKIVEKIDTIETPEINNGYMKKIKEEVNRRYEVVKATNPTNYRALAANEDKKPGFIRRLINVIARGI